MKMELDRYRMENFATSNLMLKEALFDYKYSSSWFSPLTYNVQCVITLAVRVLEVNRNIIDHLGLAGKNVYKRNFSCYRICYVGCGDSVAFFNDEDHLYDGYLLR